MRILAISSLFGISTLLAENPLLFTKWTPDLNIPDPVSLSFDNQGRAYVTQTQRRKANDLDIRQNRDWIPDDVGFESVEDKRAHYHKHLAPALSDKNRKRVKDLNKDGSHDWKDLTVLSEKIHLVEDLNNDGLADSAKIFAENFQTEITGIAAGVLWHDGSIYSTIAPDVWKISDQAADKREVIAHGFGLHIAYAGHDMHGLTIGPDGRLYWSIGDKGVRVKSREGRDFKYPNQGAVLRCELDGSNFEVFAHGLRNVQEIAFDKYGNLFGIDNDADKKGEKERFVHIVQHSDSGWRCNYQYINGFNPWTSEKLWEPRHEGQAAYILPPLQTYNNGPTGFSYNPGTALSAKYEGYFFHSQFPSGQQNAFRVEPNGASFKMVDDHIVGKGQMLIGTNFGPDGALYAVDWAGGYALNKKGGIWKIDVPKEQQHPRRATTAKLLKADFKKESPDKLIEHLGDPDQRVRLKAQFELVQRNTGKLLLTNTLSSDAPLLSRIHSLWGLGQLRRYGTHDYQDLSQLAKSPEKQLRLQYAKLLGQHQGSTITEPNLISLLSDPDLQVQFHAAIALGNLKMSDAAKPVQQATISNDGKDLHLRHAFVMALAGTHTVPQLAALAKHPSTELRLCALLALRRLSAPEVSVFLSDLDPFIVTEASRAIHDDFSIPAALPDLANRLTTARTHDTSFILRALNANFRLGTKNHAQAVANYAANPAAPLALKLDALWLLKNWSNPPLLDHVDGRRRDLEKRDPLISKNALSAVLPKLLADETIREQSLKTASALGISLDENQLLATVLDKKAPEANRTTALTLLANQKSGKLPQAVREALESGSTKLETTALPIFAKIDPNSAITIARKWLNSDQIPLMQTAISTLALISNKDSHAMLLGLVGDLEQDKLPPALVLDLESAVQSSPTFKPSHRKYLEETLKKQRSNTDPMQAFSDCLNGGNPNRGKRVTFNHLAAQCTLCHSFGQGGSTVGPNLAKIGETGSLHILQSLVDPNAVIAKGFGLGTVTLKNGENISGTFLGETKQSFSIKTASEKVVTIDKKDIASQSKPASSMPPMGAILTRRELRDLVSYLNSLK